MIKRTLYFSSPAHLSTKKNQLIVRYPDQDNEEKNVPIEDIGVVLLEHPRITLSHTLISKLLGNNVALITSDAHHLPQGLMLNLAGNHLQQAHFSEQLKATRAVKDRLWKFTIRAKITNQAGLLEQNGLATNQMQHWAAKVQNGDPDNFEARAAAWYWQRLFVDHLQGFRRGRFNGEPNNLLNYGYAILRAVAARSLVASGLLPTLGYHHRNQYNAYCLADDVMEPYRPYVDEVVLELVRSTNDYSTLTPEIKQQLLQIPILDVQIGGKTSPLMLAMQQTTATLRKCLSGEQKQMKFPVF